MNSSMYTVFVARSIVHVKHVGGGGIVGHFIFFGVTYSIIENSNADFGIIFSIFQNWLTIKAVCIKINYEIVIFLHYFDIFEEK